MSIIDTYSVSARSVLVRTRALRDNLSASSLTLGVCSFVIATGNLAFFSRLAAAYPVVDHPGFLASAFLFQVALLTFLLAPFNLAGLAKPALALTLLLAAPIAYFQDRLGIVIEEGILRSIVSTDAQEALDLFSMELLLRSIVLGALPAWLVMTARVKRQSWLREARGTGLLMAASALLMVICVFSYSATYTTFIREHKRVRYYSNPVAPIVATVRTLSAYIGAGPAREHVTIGEDAVLVPGARPKLVVMVLGETARAGNLSLNGYARQTNPLLEKRSVYSFSNVTSCATETAASVPCLFSALPRREFSVAAADSQDNLLDILSRAGVNVLWRDNNSDSKRVALRVPFEDFRHPDNNPVCDGECRDIGLLDGLDTAVSGNTLVVLHQMGSHGPAYYKRYPKEFEVFTPTCKTNELSQCSRESIVNAYDNTILYTDYFLDQVISFLASRQDDYDVAMLYVSDHGESLGEFGVYLHGMPFLMAPAEQTQVPMVLWVGDNVDIDHDRLAAAVTEPVTHDAVFGTLLKLLGVSAPSLGKLDTFL